MLTGKVLYSSQAYVYESNSDNVPLGLFSICSSEATELRRRKRHERQTAIEDQIREIKRRQRDSEEAPKKRRSLMIRIAAGVGVVVGLVCVYAYAKFG